MLKPILGLITLSPRHVVKIHRAGITSHGTLAGSDGDTYNNDLLGIKLRIHKPRCRRFRRGRQFDAVPAPRQHMGPFSILTAPLPVLYKQAHTIRIASWTLQASGNKQPCRNSFTAEIDGGHQIRRRIVSKVNKRLSLTACSDRAIQRHFEGKASMSSMRRLLIYRGFGDSPNGWIGLRSPTISRLDRRI